MWHIQTASVTGRSHRRTGAPMQDRTCVRTEYDVTAAVLADGAGSAACSQEGAEAVVQAISRYLCENFDDLYQAKTPLELRRNILVQARAAVEKRAQALGVPVRELACTLLAAAMKEDRYLLVHLGDGVIAYRKAGAVKVASHPWNGEFANSTVFVTSPNALRHCRVFRGEQAELEGFCLMSDGCEAALYNKRKQRMAPLLEILFQQTQLLESGTAGEILEAVMGGVISRCSQDDCSLILLTRKGSRFGRWEHMTPREKAAVLGVRTQNRSRRRKQVNRYAKAYGVVGQKTM